MGATNVAIVLFPRHLTPQRMPDVISHIQTFRDYFHYHIKASKAYIHSRMRRRTADFLQGMLVSTLAYVCNTLTDCSVATGQARQRGAQGAQDGERPDIQGSRLSPFQWGSVFYGVSTAIAVAFTPIFGLTRRQFKPISIFCYSDFLLGDGDPLYSQA